MNMLHIRKTNLEALMLLASVAFAAAAQAQWTVTNLHPEGASESRLNSTSGGQQLGWVGVAGAEHAGLWSGTAASWVDLHPAGATRSVGLFNSADGQQTGWAYIVDKYRAGLWSGTAGSWVDLSPPGSGESSAYGADGGHQVGWVALDHYRASLWSGTAASWVDLNPVGSTYSFALSMNHGQQVGVVVVGGEEHASLWNSTAASWIDLNPAGSDYSHANVIGDGKQGGFAYIDGVYHACLWSGTAASWFDLNPAGSVESYVYAMSGGQQVGVTLVGGAYHACLWSGTPASWVDLHAFLPREFTTSYAQGISSDGVLQYVAGYGFNSLTNRNEALLWTRSLCSAANIVSQPQPAATCPSGPAAFDVTAAGTGALTYQWQYQSGPNNPDSFTWTNLVNGRNPAIGAFRLNVTSNSSRRRLLVVDHDPTRWPDPADHIPYVFRCIVTNTCGSETSDVAGIVLPLDPCPADFNGDCSVDFFDYLDFVDAFSSQAVAGDFNHDDSIDFFDYLDFVDAFSIGC